MRRLLLYIPVNNSRVRLWALLSLFACGCRNANPGTPVETPTSGTIQISVDESFKPVIDSEIKVFESTYPDVKVIPHYKAEAECLRDLVNDSTRLVIVTRGLSSSERKFYSDSLHYIPTNDLLAYDAIAVVVNNQSKDSIFTMNDLRAMLSGNTKKDWQVVMDGVSATSTVRYAIDSVLRGAPLGPKVVAAKSSQEVVSYVAAHENAVGFVGVSWVGDEDDPGLTSFMKNVRIASLQCVSCLGETYVKPYQANIALKRYPLVRGLYYILKENFRGVGNNFVNFMEYERGQLIFQRAYLWPARMSFVVRNMQISN
ncbi:MAG: substrate-binding domain-containing protein [Puia sp.]|nr:substrate-binding domain-containing protein [Puia sp.]